MTSVILHETIAKLPSSHLIMSSETPETPETTIEPPPAVSTRQHTLGGSTRFEGLGLLLGEPVTVEVEPGCCIPL